jgi:hypothetical protein
MTTTPARSQQRRSSRRSHSGGRYHLAGDFDPANPERTYCKEGDVWFVGREGSHLWVGIGDRTEAEQGGLCGHWLSEPRIRERSPVPLEGTADLHFLDTERPRLVATDVPSPSAVWFLSDYLPAPNFRNKPSVRRLEFDRLRDTDEVRRFLEHPLIDHPRGNQTIWKAAFGARYRGDLVAVAVLGIPNPPSRYDGQTIVIDRYAAHPERPPNTGTWLLSRCREWADLEGYCVLAAKAGIGGNEGTVYRALGMEQIGGVELADGSGWTNRPNRDSWDDWEKRSFVQRLGPPDIQFRRHDKHDRWEKTRAQDTTLPGTHVRLSAFEADQGEPVGVDDCHLMRFDHHLEGVRDFFTAVRARTPALDEATAIFVAAANAEPVAAHVCTPLDRADSSSQSRQLGLTDYAHQEAGVKYPLNVGSWLAGRVRRWAELEGYDQVVGDPGDETHHAVLERAGIDTL